MIGGALVAKAGEFLAGVWAKLLVVGAIVGAVLLAIFKLMAAGRAQERANALAKAAERTQEAKDVEAHIDRTDDAGIDKLRDKWTRP